MIFDFRCRECKALEEHWVNSETRTMECECGGVADRVISGVTSILDPISGDFPGATLSWAKHHEQAAKQSSD